MRSGPWHLCACFLLLQTMAARADDFETRRSAALQAIAARPLQLGENPGTWVDVERWCVAHACLATGERLALANQYFAEVGWCSLWHGLVADTDVQLTDLLRTWFEFHDSDRLTAAARSHLAAMFADWVVPNADRNRSADRAYTWPCEYTENHSLNILVGAYLIDVVTGRDPDLHAQLLKRFLHDRARWGWSEFHSPNYAVVTAKALSLLADFAPDAGLKTAARMHLDLLALEFAAQGLGTWRGVPFARGYGRQTNNASNSFVDLARLWFGDGTDRPPSGTFLLHLVTSSYRPPADAARMLHQSEQRGRYSFTQIATHGPAKLRIPIVVWVTPDCTVASAQGFGSYYDGSYWSISVASAANRVITGRYGRGRNILQRENVLVTFGEVSWHGDWQQSASAAMTLGTDGAVWVGQLKLADDCHLLAACSVGQVEDAAGMQRYLRGLSASFADGVVSWRMPDGDQLAMRNRRDHGFWRLEHAECNGSRLRLDDNMLFDSPWLRGERDAALIDWRWAGAGRRYDFRQPEHPRITESDGAAFAALPPEQMPGPLGMQLQLVPGGEFHRGSSAAVGRANERPDGWLQLDAFYIGRTEVTVGQYRQYLAANPGAAVPPDWYWQEWGKRDEQPMTWVSWAEAEAFCAWLTGQTGEHFRLPTESEWEKAAKGYQPRVYPWGDNYDGTQSGNQNGQYLPVGSHPEDVSPFGCLDMAGNAWEWCADWYADNAYSAAPGANPRGPASGTRRAVRGCGWNFDPDTFRCAYRSSAAPGERALHIGFRVVRELD